MLWHNMNALCVHFMAREIDPRGPKKRRKRTGVKKDIFKHTDFAADRLSNVKYACTLKTKMYFTERATIHQS